MKTLRKSNIEFDCFRINNENHLYLLESEGVKNITISKTYDQVSEEKNDKYEWNGQYDIDYDGITDIYCYIDYVDDKVSIEFVEGYSIHGSSSSYELDFESDKSTIDWIINKVTKNKEFISFCNTIDKINKLEEKLLLESSGEESKLKFLEYIKGKVEPLGKVMINDDNKLVNDAKEEHTTYNVIMEGHIRDYGLCKIIDNSLDGGDSLAFITENNTLVESPMIDQIIYSARMEFEKIDSSYIELVLEYWDDCMMDEMIKEEQELSIQLLEQSM